MGILYVVALSVVIILSIVFIFVALLLIGQANIDRAYQCLLKWSDDGFLWVMDRVLGEHEYVDHIPEEYKGGVK